MNFYPIPNLSSERISLSGISERDVDTIFFLRTDANVTKYIQRPANRQTKTSADALKFIGELKQYAINNVSLAWGIKIPENDTIIGTICLWNFSEEQRTAEVGYDLKPEFQGKGYMSEALKLVINFAFDTLKLEKIEAFTNRDNLASVTLLEAHKFICAKHRVDENNKANLIFELSNLP